MRTASREPSTKPTGDAGSVVTENAGSGEMTAVRVARQPILDREARLVGYELLFRAPETDSAGVFDPREATATVILDGLLDVGLSDLVGARVWRM